MKNKEPEFSAYELNELQSLAMRSDYYKKCYRFVMDFVDGRLGYNTMTEKQQRWLHGICNELKELLGD